MPKQKVKKRKKVAAGKRLFRSAAEGLTVGVRLFKIFVENFLRFYFLSFCPFLPRTMITSSTLIVKLIPVFKNVL
jgi:hypothetical protein